MKNDNLPKSNTPTPPPPRVVKHGGKPDVNPDRTTYKQPKDDFIEWIESEDKSRPKAPPKQPNNDEGWKEPLIFGMTIVCGSLLLSLFLMGLLNN